jgi:hypothetical protein
MPPAGSVRIVSRSVPDKPGVLHRKWSLIGERNWSEANATDTVIRLARPSPLNDPEKKSGCNIWECDLIISPKSTDANTLTWTARIHGSDGTTKEGNGETTVSNGMDAVRVELDRDAVLRLPADAVLARIGDKTITLSVAR